MPPNPPNTTSSSKSTILSDALSEQQLEERIPHFFTDLTPGGVFLGGWEPRGVYPRDFLEVLGSNDTGFSESDLFAESASRCFNCGSSSHLLFHCPHPRDNAVIELSRGLFQSVKAQSTRDDLPRGRIHEVEGWKLQRLQWIEAFVPGEIRGELLQEALSSSSSHGQEWLANMAIWGYPPGWSSPINPQDSMRTRILGEPHTEAHDDNSVDEENGELFIIFGDAEAEHINFRMLSSSAAMDDTINQEQSSPGANYNHSSLSETQETAPEFSHTTVTYDERKSPLPSRWARYPITHFSSELLPIYTGFALPTLAESPTAEAQSSQHMYDAMWSGVLHSHKAWDEPPPPPPTTPPPLPSPPPLPPPPLPPIPLGADDGEGEGEMDLSDSD
ncbi:hypothetical protein ONZ45_g19175 [Pleurotus djamor]|nr:hypothetical protein ONZ45_g19175 [Pleurotus djamor]